MARWGLPILALGAALSAASAAAALELSSPDVAEGHLLAQAQVYSECGGANISPALTWSGAPDGTKSFAVTLYDPDAPGGWWHWIVYNIPPATHALERGDATPPAGALTGENDFGANTYSGACPPPGSGYHHYRFTLWALGVATAPFGAGATGKTVELFLKAHALASTTLTALFER
jgi:Raf kinase inhibitor-like YbhB/YbcL family protein